MQPKVAAQRPPWERCHIEFQPQRGCIRTCGTFPSQNKPALPKKRQRRFILQPKVAAQRPPWERCHIEFQPQRGCIRERCHIEFQPQRGYIRTCDTFPSQNKPALPKKRQRRFILWSRVAAQRSPWVLSNHQIPTPTGLHPGTVNPRHSTRPPPSRAPVRRRRPTCAPTPECGFPR